MRVKFNGYFCSKVVYFQEIFDFKFLNHLNFPAPKPHSKEKNSKEKKGRNSREKTALPPSTTKLFSTTKAPSTKPSITTPPPSVTTPPPSPPTTQAPTQTASANQGVCSCSPCLNGGTCVDMIGEPLPFKCKCPLGFVGLTCDTEQTTSTQAPVSQGICSSNPCQNGGTCVDLVGELVPFKCLCSQGFTGFLCDAN